MGESIDRRSVVNTAPFVDETRFRFTDSNEPGTIQIFDLVGQRVRTINFRASTTRPLAWDGLSDNGTRVSAGAYIYRITQGKKTYSGKVIRRK